MATYNPNQKEDKKKGFLPFFSRMFDTASKTVGSVGAGAVKGGGMLSKAGFLASLFSTKAGVIGLLLGAATIAAGIGLIYNYISPSSGKIYTPALFSDAYYQEAQKQANAERANTEVSPAVESSLSKFAEAAQKEFGSNLPKEESSSSESTKESTNSNDSVVPQPVSVPQSASAGGKLQANLGFNNTGNAGGGGGSSSVGGRLQTSGGLWNNLGKQFSPIGGSASKLQGSAKTANMNKALSARLIASPKYQVPNINKKGAFGQAKFAGKVGVAAAYNPTDASARTTAEQAFSGETTGTGDIATPIGGSGLGGAGLSQGKLKANDPALNTNEYTPPTPHKTDDTPWKKLVDKGLYAMLIAGGLIFATRLIANLAKGNPFLYTLAYATAISAIASALVVVMVGIQLWTKYGQKMMGLMYVGIGLALVWQAYEALMGIESAKKEWLADKIGTDPKDIKSVKFNSELNQYEVELKNGKMFGVNTKGNVFPQITT